MKNILHRDDYWLGLAFFTAAGSTIKPSQACIIIGQNSEFLGMGINGPPKTMQNAKHTVSAELNAILNCKFPIQSATAYLTHTPTYQSALNLISANIKRIVYFPTENLSLETEDVICCAYAQIDKFNGNLNWMRDYIKSLDIF